MESKYTRLLIENFLLFPLEMTDTALMAGFQKNTQIQDFILLFFLKTNFEICKKLLTSRLFAKERLSAL
ncbi:RepB [Lactococcus cremoris]|nr:RepB [Lactococcus cremoris]